MGDLSPGRNPIRRERLARRGPAWAWAGWALLSLFIIAGSAGHWSLSAPGIWAPTLVNPVDVAVNVALYVPFGVLGMVALRRSDFRGVLRVMGVAILFSIANEALQLYTVDRVASLTDIASAALGSSTGALLVGVFTGPR